VRYSSFAWLVASRFLFLLATYIVGRFLLYFVAERLGLSSDQAAELAGSLLAGLALITVLGSPLAGCAADRLGRVPLMRAGAVLSALGVLLLIKASSAWQILAFGALMSLGSAAFASASWAMTADLAPSGEAARFFGLANFGTAGAAAAAGLFGPLVDWTNRISPGTGYPLLFVVAAFIFLSSVLVLKRSLHRSNRAVPDVSGIQEHYPALDPTAFEQLGVYKGDKT
jgi:MFS family permease